MIFICDECGLEMDFDEGEECGLDGVD